MNFHVLTLFPEYIEAGMMKSITGKAIDSGVFSLEAVNIRDYAAPERKGRIDDYTYGGGAGMLMQAQPVYDCYQSVCSRLPEGKKVRTVYLTPQGRPFTQDMAVELAKEEDLILLCGHYEGIDERVLEEICTDYISIGDYVLTGGEVAALVVMDAVARMIPGVLHNAESGEDESFSGDLAGLLEYPQYSRPEVWRGKSVPPVLLSGHHGNVDAWRREKALERTLERRPELLENAQLSKKDRKYLENILANRDDLC